MTSAPTPGSLTRSRRRRRKSSPVPPLADSPRGDAAAANATVRTDFASRSETLERKFLSPGRSRSISGRDPVERSDRRHSCHAKGLTIYVDARPHSTPTRSAWITPLSTIRFQNISLKSTLNLILKSARLNFVVKDEVIQITTERIAAPFQTACYQVEEFFPVEIIPVELEDASSLRPCLLRPSIRRFPPRWTGLYPETS